MKLLLVTPYFPPRSGGLENYAFNIAQGLIKTYNYEVVVVTSNPGAKTQVVEEYFGIKVYRLPIMFQVGNTPINPLWYVALKKIIRTEKPDIINSHQPVPFIGDVTASLAGNIPFVLTYHTGTMHKNKLLYDVIIFLYEKFILPCTAKKASRIICASNFVRNTILKKYTYKSVVVHPGVDISLFQPNPSIEREKNLVLFICHYKSMHRAKGLYYLLEAVKLLPEVKVRVVGEVGDFEDERVSFAGMKWGNDLVEEMQKASIVILPSTGAMEGFPMVLIEAMACQTPVIGTDLGGIPEVIREGIDGFVLPTTNSSALALAILKILTNPELATRMGQAGAAKVRETLTWDSRVDLTKEVYESCLK